MLQHVIVIAGLAAATVASVSVALYLTRLPGAEARAPARPSDRSPYRSAAEDADPSHQPRWWGKHGVVAEAFIMLSLASAAALAALVGFGDDESFERRWAFTRDVESIGVLGLVASSNEAGVWSVEPDPRGTGAHVLVNHAGVPGAKPAVAVAIESKERNVHARTRCRVLGAGQAPACGLVFRHRDDANYYSARVDRALQEVVLSVVENGHERILGRSPARLDAEIWQEVAVDARGDRIAVFWNDERALEVQDSTHRQHGSVGLWTTATAIAHFDEFVVERLPSRPLFAFASAPGR
jgi:hypothetical protein